VKKQDGGPQIVRAPGSSIPIPVGRDTDLAQHAKECLETVARDVCPIVEDLDDIGKSYLEVAINNLARAATYDPTARTEFLDRIMGKPRQHVDTTSVSLNLVEYLQMLAEEEEKAEREVIIDAEPSVPNAPEVEDGFPFLR